MSEAALREALQKIVASERVVKDLALDSDANPSQFLAAGFRGAVRIARDALRAHERQSGEKE